MRCDDALVAVSLRADDELTGGTALGDLDAHLATCDGCGRFEADIHGVRTQLRLEPVDHAPDLAPAVTARLRAATAIMASDIETEADATSTVRRGEGPSSARARRPGRTARGDGRDQRSPRRRLAAAAAAVIAGMVAGAAFVGLGTQPRSPAAADVPDRVLAAQHDIDTVDSRFTITEQAWAARTAAGNGEPRTFDGHLVYRAPESLALTVRETTDSRGVPADQPADQPAGRLVVDGDRWWQETARQCSPAAGLVRCPAGPVMSSRSVSGRAPFSDAAPVPLELVSPVDAFSLAAAPADVGHRTIAGHRAVGVAVTAAQVSALLDSLSAGTELRPVHPGDPVELWLDEDHMVPLGLVVRAGDDPARLSWAATVGADDRPGAVILTVDATDIRINDAADITGTTDRAFDVPAAEASTSTGAGFRATPADDASVADVPVPGVLPDGFAAHRAGTVTTPDGPAVGVRSWSDGRAWLTVQATTAWTGGRLFGGLGPDVVPLDLGAAGMGYASSDGRRVGLHTDGVDVVASGSLPPARLQEIAADLGVVGETVPTDWAEAAVATLDDAVTVVPGLMTARRADGFGTPAVRTDAADTTGTPDRAGGHPGGTGGGTGETVDSATGTVTQSYAGPGQRAFVLTQRRSTDLPPPSSGDESGVEVRGTPGRYSHSAGELEWLEDGVAVSLRSDTVGLGELLAIAERMEPA